jgi:purine nucleosidase
MNRIPVVIDTDAGIDDVVALALAVRSAELRVVAATTTYGNATLGATTRNTREVLQLAGGEEVPVHPGADRPLVRPLVTAPETHGESGVGYARVPAEQAGHRIANPDVLLAVLSELDAPVTLVTLGPLTNLAHALARDAALVRRRVARHLGMFGNMRERGNTNRWADFNAWCDPEAADAVIRADLPTEMVGLDVTRRMTFSANDVRSLAASPDRLARWLERALWFYVEFHRHQERLDGCVVNDVLPIGELIAPGVLGWQALPLTVDLDDGPHRGHTRERAEGTPTRVAMEVDVATMRELLQRVGL